MRTSSRSLKSVALTLASGLLFSGASVAGTSSDPTTNNPNVTVGRAAVYQQLPESSLEQLSTPDHIVAVTQGNTAPTEIWRVLEHGEKVECLDCIPDVAKLLYDGNAKTREISAWWLRRRIFGVFGQGEVYSQVLSTLTSATADTTRSYAAEALGEFLIADGIAPVAKAAVTDSSSLVRRSAVRALERLNNEGPAAELATAISDKEPEVRLAALHAAVSINVFSNVDAIVSRLSDDSADVRRRAAESLGTIHATDAVVGLIGLADPSQESDPRVRTAAIGALGKIGDPAAHDAVLAATGDSDPLVQSIAKIALRRL
ncbi:MAG TPA: HEAT repeat domain-containing protein [Polyangiaceae bacterium]|jgi:HEAT repeat protein|nr:HEAT repeat domain-containing protein [Polyangiaceae bacterium]